MKRNYQIVLSGLIVFFALPGSTRAAEPDLFYSNQQKLSYLSVGIGGIMINETSVNTQSIAASIQYRRMLRNSKFSFSGQANPVLQKTSLFGVHLNAGVGYNFLGHPATETEAIDRKDTILYQKQDRSSVIMFLDASLSMLPIFGSTNTATYSGFNFAWQTYLSPLPIQFTAQYSSLTLGARSVQVMSGYVGYYWNL